jgi:putative methyltransferase (TIGR04325 family)
MFIKDIVLVKGRKVLRYTVPPLVWDWIHSRFGGVFKIQKWPTSTNTGGWVEAASIAVKGYEPGIRRFTLGEALSYLPEEEPFSWIDNDSSFHHRLVQFGIVAARCSNSYGELNILDYGGGFGTHVQVIKRLLPKLKYNYTVCELPAFCAQGRKLNPDIQFKSSLSSAGKGYDLVYASSSVQYTEDWRLLLRDLCAACKGSLFVTRTPFVFKGSTFIVMQRAYDTQYPGWVFNKDEFVNEVHASSSLRLREVFVNGRGLAIRGAVEPNMHLGLLFE